jgi:hypothetical protein
MTRYAIDAAVALRLVGSGEAEPTPAAGDALVGPVVLRSDALRLLYADVRSGGLDEREGRRRLDRLAGLRIRLLGDRVSRATAWRLAVELGWDDPGPAEYLAVAMLQADVLVTLDRQLERAATGRIPTASIDVLLP